MDLIFKLYAHKLFWVQNVSQIRETTIFCPFCHFGVKITNFSKMDFIFKLYAQKLFWVQNFSQIRETTIFCPFGVKITNFSIIIKCSQNRIDLQIVNTKTVPGAKFQPNQRNYNTFALFSILAVKLTNFSKMNIVFKFETLKLFSVQNFSQIRETTIFCPFGVRITNFSKMIKCSQNRIDLQIVNTKTVLGAKFQSNQSNYNILSFLPFQGSKLQTFQKWTSFSNYMHKNWSGYKISTKSEKLQYFALLGSKLQTFQ